MSLYLLQILAIGFIIDNLTIFSDGVPQHYTETNLNQNSESSVSVNIWQTAQYEEPTLKSYNYTNDNITQENADHLSSSYVVDEAQDIIYTSDNIRNSELIMPDKLSTIANKKNRSKPIDYSLSSEESSSIGVARDRNGTLKIVYPTTNPKHNQFKPNTSKVSPPQRPVPPSIRNGPNQTTRFTPVPTDIESETTHRDSDIVFPDDAQTLRNRINFNEIPRCKSSDIFCTEVDNYPDELINQILRNEGHKYDELFGEDRVEGFNLSQRIDVPGEIALCESREQVIYPKMGLNSDEKWRLIVNSANYTQGIRIETCMSQNSKCHFTESFPNGYTSECKQKYIHRHLVSIDENGSTVKDMYKIPSCCKCILTYNYGKKKK